MQVRIFQPTKSATQSPTFSCGWVLEFVHQSGQTFQDSRMGRVASMDMLKELSVKFDTLEAAKLFAEENNYQYEIIQPKHQLLIKKNYADNFC